MFKTPQRYCFKDSNGASVTYFQSWVHGRSLSPTIVCFMGKWRKPWGTFSSIVISLERFLLTSHWLLMSDDILRKISNLPPLAGGNIRIGDIMEAIEKTKKKSNFWRFLWILLETTAWHLWQEGNRRWR